MLFGNNGKMVRLVTMVNGNFDNNCNVGKICGVNFNIGKDISDRYTGCPRRNVQYFGRVFLLLNYTDITQNTYIQS